MSTTRRNTKRSFTQRDKRSFYLVASDVFFGLNFLEKETFFDNTKKSLRTTPSFYYYNNQQKVLIDYSNSKNEDDLNYIFSFFSGITAGVTFSISYGNYTQDSANIVADISGIYEFESIENSKIIKANIISGTNLSNKKDNYIPRFFLKTPELNRNGNLSNKQQKTNIVKNVIGDGLYSFKRMGIHVGDFVDFSGTNSNDRKKFKVIDYYRDTDGFETIQLDYPLVNENNIGNSVIINVYFEGETDTEVNLSEKTYGSCRFDGICFNVQNEFMCNKRAEQLNISKKSYIASDSCEDFAERLRNNEIQDIFASTSNIVTIGNGITLDNIPQNLLIQEPQIAGITSSLQLVQTIESPTVVAVTSIRPKVNFKVVPIRIQNGQLVDSKTLSNKITVNQNSTLKINLEDFSLANYTFDLYSDSNYKQPITTNISRNGKPGSGNSYITLVTSVPSRTVYLKSKESTFFVIQIDII